MIITAKSKGFICTTAHPLGCEENVKRQISYIKSRPQLNRKQRVLIIGSSSGYGLSSRICETWSNSSSTIGVCFEKSACRNRTATAGWYNTAAFEKFASKDGFYAKTIIGDAFSVKTKAETIKLIKNDLKKIDLVVYSLAAPKRTMPDGSVYSSVLKTLDYPYSSKGINLEKISLNTKTVFPATPEEIIATDHVMGGEDWIDWIETLKAEEVLSANARTVAYSYIGPQMTYPIYYNGTIGHAKQHLYNSSLEITKKGIPAYISVNKALVTQSSAAIPVVPLYISILYRIMKEKGTHENSIEQMYRLWSNYLYAPSIKTDAEGRIRMDDWELDPETQQKVNEYYQKITDETLSQYADIKGYVNEFHHLFGFDYDNVDYMEDTAINVWIPSISPVSIN